MLALRAFEAVTAILTAQIHVASVDSFLVSLTYLFAFKNCSFEIY